MAADPTTLRDHRGDARSPEPEYEQTMAVEIVVAVGRDETDACQAGTPGCCVNHAASKHGCEAW